MTASIDTTIAPSLPRRALLQGAPALAVVTAVAAETGIALASAADPYPALCAAYFHHWNACNNCRTGDEGDREHDAWAKTCDRIAATRPTTIAGVLAALRVLESDIREFDPESDSPNKGDTFRMSIITGAIAVLEREVARG